jgi:GrpB-like predicted nucleotidyltransferase (UPF0157 family)
LHLTKIGSQFWCDQLTFRNRLRADAALRSAYEALKVELARAYRTDREAYINGKTAFNEGALRTSRGSGT